MARRAVTTRTERTGKIAVLLATSGYYAEAGTVTLRLDDAAEQIALDRAQLMLVDAGDELTRVTQLAEPGAVTAVRTRVLVDGALEPGEQVAVECVQTLRPEAEVAPATGGCHNAGNRPQRAAATAMNNPAPLAPSTAGTALFGRRPIPAFVLNPLIIIIAGLAARTGVEMRELPDVARVTLGPAPNAPVLRANQAKGPGMGMIRAATSITLEMSAGVRAVVTELQSTLPPDVRRANFDASTIRLHPVMMTMTSTVLGGVPLLLSSRAGAEAREALGRVIVGGLGLTPLSTLYLTPVAYLLLAGFWTPKVKKEQRLQRELQEAQAL